MVAFVRVESRSVREGVARLAAQTIDDEFRALGARSTDIGEMFIEHPLNPRCVSVRVGVLTVDGVGEHVAQGARTARQERA